MRITATTIFIALAVLLLALAGICLLQRYLAGREKRWPGLVLPGAALLFSLYGPLNMAAPPEGVTPGFVLEVVLVWLLGCIPALLLLAIYAICREKRRRSRQLDRMNIQDLG